MMHASHGGIYNSTHVHLLRPAVLMQAQCQHLSKRRPMRARYYKPSDVRNSMSTACFWKLPAGVRQSRASVWHNSLAWPHLLHNVAHAFRSMISLESCP